MDKCSPCLCTLTLPTCFDTLVIGTVGAINTAYKVYIEDTTVHKVTQYSATSTAGGQISISITGQFAENHSYNLWATLGTATPDELEDILISGATQNHTCFELKFETVKDSTGNLAEFTSVTLKKDSCCDEGLNNPSECCYAGILEGTYAQIVAALTAGIDTEKYSHVLITDFQTIYDQPDFDGAGVAKVAVTTKTSSVTEPLLIGLLDANTLQAEAHSALYPKDQLRYDITFSQTEVMAAAAKGRITERIDHLNNRTDYDHRTVLFKRYESAPASGTFNQYKDNGGASQEFTTFQFVQEIIDGFPGGFSNNNYIGDYAILFVPYANPFLLSNNVFGKNAEDNKTPTYTVNNTWGDGANSNIYQNDVFACVFANNHSFNQFNGLYNSSFGIQFNQNSFTGIISDTVFGDDCNENSGGAIQSCIIGNLCVQNDFGTSINILTFGNGLTNNNFYNTANTVDFTAATHVYASYHCSIFFNAASVLRLSYFDAADALIVVNANA